MRLAPSPRLLLLLPLLFAGMLALGATIGPSSSTETRYCVMAREMLLSGDWIVPTFNRAPLLEKPPFEYWGTACAMAIAGVNDLAPRLPHLLAGALTLLVVATIARRLSPDAADGRARARLAALALGTMPSFLVQTYTIAPDAWLLLAMTCAGWALLEADRAPGRVPLRWVLLLQGALGVGMLVKGPLALGLVFGAAAATALLRRRARILAPFAHPLGWLLFAAVAVPWYLALDHALPGVLATLVDRRLFGGLSSSSDFHAHGVHTVWGPIAGAFPWLAALPGAIALLVRGGRFRHGPGLPAALLALAAPLLFTFSASRLPSYGSPAYPWIAVLVALGAPSSTDDDAPRGWRSMSLALARAARGYAVAAAVVVAGVAVGFAPPATAVVVAAVIAAAAIVVAFRTPAAGLLASPVARAAVASTLFVFTAGVLVLAAPERVGVARALGTTLVARRAKDEPYAVLLNYNGDWGVIPWSTKSDVLFFDYPSAPMIVAPEAHRPDLFRPASALAPWLASPGRRWLFLRPRDRVRLVAAGVPLTVVAAAHEYELVATVPPDAPATPR